MIPFLLLLAVGLGQAGFQCDAPGKPACEWPKIASMKIAAIGKLKCADNQHIEGDGKSEAGNHCVDDKPAPLKCGKWEHRTHKAGVPCDTDDNYLTCKSDPTDYCAPDLHVVTEKQWQEIMERLKKLEKDSVRMTEPVIACDDPQNAKGCRWMPNPNVVHPER